MLLYQLLKRRTFLLSLEVDALPGAAGHTNILANGGLQSDYVWLLEFGSKLWKDVLERRC